MNTEAVFVTDLAIGAHGNIILRCECCREPLEMEHEQFDMPLTQGNPYPEPITVCGKPACKAWALRFQLEAFGAARDEYEPDEWETEGAQGLAG